jgi:hypothetical protein
MTASQSLRKNSVHITWNENEKRFEAQFARGDNWHTEQAIASDAGFRSDGPPAWIWRTATAAALTKLKESRASLSGLSITREALDAYNRLLEVEKKNEELKAYAKEQKKKLKKDQEHAKIEAQQDAEDDGEIEPEYEPSHYHEIPEYWLGKSEITRADLPASVMARLDKHESIPQRRAVPTGSCVQCSSSIYFYEQQNPPTCLFCETQGQEKFLDELI